MRFTDHHRKIMLECGSLPLRQLIELKLKVLRHVFTKDDIVLM